MLPFPPQASPPMPMMGPSPMSPPMGMPPLPPGPAVKPPWASPKKPKAATAIETAQKDRERFAGYAEVVSDFAAKLEPGRVATTYPRVDPDDPEDEHFPLVDLRAEHERFCSWGANHDLFIRAPVSDELDADEAAMKEDAAYYWIECFQRQFASSGDGGDLMWALWDTLATYGRLATLVTLDLYDEESGLSFRLLDPATTFPVFEGKRGLHHVSLVYGATANEVLGWHGNDAKVERALKRQIGKSDSDLGLDTEGEVVEWIDRGWHAVYWNGVEVKCAEHGYGFVPIRYDRGPWGRQAFTSSTAIDDLAVTRISVETPNGWRGGYTRRASGTGSARLDESRVGLPFQYWKLKAHKVKEAFMSRYLTAALYMTDPAVWVTEGYEAERKGLPEAKIERGKTYTLREDERAEIPQLPFYPQILQTVANEIVQGQALGSAGPIAFGMAAPQTTGSAAGILDAEGKEIWAPGLRTMQNHVTGVIELAATIYRDWGDLIGAPGSRGSVPVPRRNPLAGQRQAFDLTPGVLERSGIRYTVELHRFNPMTITQMAPGIVQYIQAGILPEEDAIRIAGWTPDPRAAMERRRREQLRNAPERLQADQLRVLQEEVNKAAAAGDEASLIQAIGERDYVARIMAESEMQKAMMRQSMMQGQVEDQMGGPPPPGVPPEMLPPPPGMPPEGGPSPIPPGGVASLPAMGIPVGTQGGRPPMPGPPAPMPGVR